MTTEKQLRDVITQAELDLGLEADEARRADLRWKLSLLDQIRQSGNAPCWQWIGPTQRDGWPVAYSPDGLRRVQIRRVFYEWLVDRLGETALTSTCACRRKTCCNPWFLRDTGVRKGGASRSAARRPFVTATDPPRLSDAYSHLAKAVQSIAAALAVLEKRT